MDVVDNDNRQPVALDTGQQQQSGKVDTPPSLINPPLSIHLSAVRTLYLFKLCSVSVYHYFYVLLTYSLLFAYIYVFQIKCTEL